MTKSLFDDENFELPDSWEVYYCWDYDSLFPRRRRKTAMLWARQMYDKGKILMAQRVTNEGRTEYVYKKRST